jgi:hypothetical protein
LGVHPCPINSPNPAALSAFPAAARDSAESGVLEGVGLLGIFHPPSIPGCSRPTLPKLKCPAVAFLGRNDPNSANRRYKYSIPALPATTANNILSLWFDGRQNSPIIREKLRVRILRNFHPSDVVLTSHRTICSLAGPVPCTLLEHETVGQSCLQHLRLTVQGLSGHPEESPCGVDVG